MGVVGSNDNPPFAQDVIADMARAVDNVCEILEISPEDAPTIKFIAERVVDHAKRGERDPAVLAERVIDERDVSSGRVATGLT